ncbi:MAG: cyclic nucleotide-binding domain-containing protein [Kiritimatiellaeota bacterium]|nr:cyclic nucleotide-binding domain-containing protein [Kiritimatiellota bacterium]
MNIKVLDDLGLEQVTIEAGTAVLEEGRRTRKVYVLISGSVDIKARKQHLATVDMPGAILGEISALMGTEPVATATTKEDSSFYVIEDFSDFMREHPEACLSVAQILACRLVNMNNHLVHIKEEIAKLQEGLDSYLPVFPENFRE